MASSNSLTQQIKRLGVVAGEGKLPPILARSAREKGYSVVAFALTELAQARMEPQCEKVYLIAPGQIGRNAHLMKEEGVTSVVFVGKVPKMALLRNLHKLDWVALQELAKLNDFSDDSINFLVGNFAEKHGVKVLTQSEFLRELFPNVGQLSKRQPTAAEYADIQYGMRIAKELARLDIGQTVVVKDQMVVAIEAIEGTDECIKRSVQMADGPVVVCKVAKPSQDQRFDIPTVGSNTLQAMVAKKPGGVLAIEANETMVIDLEDMTAFADEHDMSVVST
jgi:DUF1009 family protein